MTKKSTILIFIMIVFASIMLALVCSVNFNNELYINDDIVIDKLSGEENQYLLNISSYDCSTNPETVTVFINEYLNSGAAITKVENEPGYVDKYYVYSDSNENHLGAEFLNFNTGIIEDTKLVLVRKKIVYNISYYDEDLHIIESLSSTYTVGDELTIATYVSQKEQYRFEYWRDQSKERVDSISSSQLKDLKLYAYSTKFYLYKISVFNYVDEETGYSEEIKLDTTIDNGNNVEALDTILGYKDTYYYYDESIPNHQGTVYNGFNALISENLHLVLDRQIVRYKLNYYDTANTLMEDISREYTILDTIVLEDYLPSENYKFIGWQTSSKEFVTSISSSDAKNYYLYSYCLALYNFNIHGFGDDVVELNIATVQDFIDWEIENNENRIGYNWVSKLREDATLDFTTNDTVNLTLDNEPGSSVDLYMSYKLCFNQITYLGLEGANFAGTAYPGNPNKTMYTIETEEFTIQNPYKDGYNFIGWSGTDIIGLTTTLVINSDTPFTKKTFTANWEPKVFTVTCDVAGGTDYLDNTFTATYDEKYDNLLADPTKVGYSFNGWYLGNTLITSDSKVQSISNHVIVAHWTANVYEVSYNTNGGDAIEANTKVTYNKTYTLETPKKEGYSFSGWYYEDIKFEPEVYNVPTSIELLARWSANTYNITVYAHDEGAANLDVVFGERVELIVQNLIDAEGYIIGFYTAPNGSGDLVSDHDGIVDQWNIARNTNIYAFYIVEESYVNSATIFAGNLPDNLSLYVDSNEIDSNTILTQVGRHNLQLLDADKNTKLETIITIKADLGIEEGAVYYEPFNFKNIDAVVMVDDKEIDLENYRFDRNGKHVVKVLGSNGYEVVYNITFDNKNYTYFWYILAGSCVLAVGAIVLLSLGRRKMIIYDNNRE